jgi:MoxR-like ATPase
MSFYKKTNFANFVLADEINRAPAKAVCFAWSNARKQVTIGDTTFKLDRPLVLATQNPIEQEGTYQLPEAQVDRFMLKRLLIIKWMKSV